MMKVILSFLSFAAIVNFFIYPRPVLGQPRILPQYYPNTVSDLPFGGQNHSYSVVLRGNGEAIVILKAVFKNSNMEGKILNNLSFRLPSNVIPSDIAVYQIAVDEYCIRYSERKYIQDEDADNGGYYTDPYCLEFNKPDYFKYQGAAKYLKANYVYSGDELNITIPKNLTGDQSGAVLIYFRAMGYAKRNIFGAFNFKFETLKINDTISKVNVGIITDSDLFIKGNKGEVDYRYTADTSMMLKSFGNAGGAALSIPTVDKAVSQLGQGNISKSASNLGALETYKVSGIYADSKIKLYSREILIGILIFILITAVIVLISRRLVRNFKPIASVAVVRNPLSTNIIDEKGKLILISLGVSFISSIVLAGYILLTFMLFKYIGNLDYQLGQLMLFGSVIFSIIIFSIFLIAPGVYFGYKKGFGWGVLTVVLTIAWLAVYFVFWVVFIMLLRMRSFYYRPYYGPLL